MYNTIHKQTFLVSYNAILSMFCLLRFWFILKYILVNSEFYSPRIQRICQMNNFEPNIFFSMKSIMIKTPYKMYTILFIIVLAYCTFCLRIFERELDPYSGLNFGSYWNTIWCLIITMTTVGYGDFYPSSFMGRIIGIISCMSGVFLISMLIVAITNILDFKGCEKNVYVIMDRIELMEEKDMLASKLLGKYLKIINLSKKSAKIVSDSDKVKFERQRDKLRESFLITLFDFKEKCKEYDSTFPSYSNFDIIAENLEYLETTMESLSGKYDNLRITVETILKKLNL